MALEPPPPTRSLMPDRRANDGACQAPTQESIPEGPHMCVRQEACPSGRSSRTRTCPGAPDPGFLPWTLGWLSRREPFKSCFQGIPALWGSGCDPHWFSRLNVSGGLSLRCRSLKVGCLDRGFTPPSAPQGEGLGFEFPLQGWSSPPRVGFLARLWPSLSYLRSRSLSQCFWGSFVFVFVFRGSCSPRSCRFGVLSGGRACRILLGLHLEPEPGSFLPLAFLY